MVSARRLGSAMLLVLAVGSLLAVTWAVGKESGQEELELQLQQAGVLTPRIKSRTSSAAQQHGGLASEAPTALEHELGPAPGQQHGNLAGTVADLRWAVSPAGPRVNSSSLGHGSSGVPAGSSDQSEQLVTEESANSIAVQNFAPRRTGACSGSSCPAHCAVGYNGDYDGPCTACPAGTYGFGAPYTCGSSSVCKNVARSCGSDGSSACAASQISTHGEGAAGRAVDGGTNGIFDGGTCTHTSDSNRQQYPWWMVDFGTSRNIVMVQIYGRTDCCPDRLNGFQIRIGDSPDLSNPICSLWNAYPDPMVTVPCKGRGRYLTVSLPTSEPITLCEVLAWGPQPGWDWASECNDCPAGTYSAALAPASTSVCLIIALCVHLPLGLSPHLLPALSIFPRQTSTRLQLD